MNDHDEIFRQLDKQGWAISDTAIPLSWHITLLMQGWNLWETGHFHLEGIGRSAGDATRHDIRGDTICWDHPGSLQADHPIFNWLASRRTELNQASHIGPPLRSAQRNVGKE